MFYYYSFSKNLFSLVTFSGFAFSLLAIGSGVQAMKRIEAPSLEEVKRHLTSPQPPIPGQKGRDLCQNTLTHEGNGQYTSVSRFPVITMNKHLSFEVVFKMTAQRNAPDAPPFHQKITVPSPDFSSPELTVTPPETRNPCPMATLTIRYPCSPPFEEKVKCLFPPGITVSNSQVVLTLHVFGDWLRDGNAFIEGTPPPASLGDEGAATTEPEASRVVPTTVPATPADAGVKPEEERTQTPPAEDPKSRTQDRPKEVECCIS